VLSENAGSYEELGDWVECVSPFDVYGQAEALYRALTLDPAERRRRAEAIKAHVREHDLTAWVEALLADFERAGSGSGA
jgi:trehalose 6-phosphate synthase